MVVLGEKNFQQQEGLPRVQEIAHASTESSDRVVTPSVIQLSPSGISRLEMPCSPPCTTIECDI